MASAAPSSHRFYVVHTGEEEDATLTLEGARLKAAAKQLVAGKPVATAWPSDAAATVRAKKLGPDVFENALGLWVVSPRVRAALERTQGRARVEYLPLALRDAKGKELCPGAVVVHPLDVVDCGRGAAEDLEFELERVQDAPPLFRMRGATRSIVLRYETALALNEGDLGVTWQKAVAESKADRCFPLVADAIQARSLPKLKAAFAKGATVEARDVDRGYTPLRYALLVGVPPLARWLLEQGADVHERSEAGETLLHDTSDPELIDALVRRGVEVDARDDAGRTALHRQSRARGPEAAAALLAHGADLEAVTKEGLTPLHIAARDSLEVVRLLLTKGARVDPRTQEGKTALAIAVDSAVEDFQNVYLDDPKAFARMARADKETTQKDLDGLRAQRDLVQALLAAGARRDEAPAKQWKRFGALEAFLAEQDGAAHAQEAADAALAQPAAKDWARRVGARLQKAGEAELPALATQVLGSKEAIAHPAWPTLVERLLDRTESLRDAAAKATGKRMSWKALEDLEGLESITDGMCITVESVLQLLSAKEALARPDWADLLLRTCEVKLERLGSYSWGDAEVGQLVRKREVKGHARAKALLTAVQRAFPYAELGAK